MSFDILRHSRKKMFVPVRILAAVIITSIFTATAQAQTDDKPQAETSVTFEIQQGNPSSFDNLAYAGNGTKVTASSSFSENYAKHPAAGRQAQLSALELAWTPQSLRFCGIRPTAVCRMNITKT